MDRKSYWNDEYVKYWKEVTEEGNNENLKYSNIKKIGGLDYKTVGDKNAELLFDDIPFRKDLKLLDYGCGFGRFYSYFNEKCDYYGIDISEAMIESFIDLHPEAYGRVLVSEGEKLPYENNSFDIIICFGVFDACYQEDAIFEMLRVCKDNGYLFVTGKNTNYFLDDEQAFIAEEAARRKNHPNYFSDVNNLKKQLEEYTSIVNEKYYLRRGDFGKGQYVINIPDYFYEWELLLKKNNSNINKFNKFSSDYSNTWEKLKIEVKKWE